MKNPDQVSSEAVIQELQRINPTILQLAISNVRAEQWKEYALSEDSDPAEVEPAEVK